MNTNIAATCNRPPMLRDTIQEEIEQTAAQLRIITSIERGHSVVPVLEDGRVLLRRGEVAVYKEERLNELLSGLYCLERQRSVAMSPWPESPRKIEREVVYVRSNTRLGVADAASKYITLRSRVINRICRYVPPEGPLKMTALGDLLHGPIIGIYGPTSIAGEAWS